MTYESDRWAWWKNRLMYRTGPLSRGARKGGPGLCVQILLITGALVLYRLWPLW